MFETPNNMRIRNRRGNKVKDPNRGQSRLQARQQALSSFTEETLLNIDRYNQWWLGPSEDHTFKPAAWSLQHTVSGNALFTMAVIQGYGDKNACETPFHDFKLFLGTLRRFYTEDIVLAVESETLLQDGRIKQLLIDSKCVVYEMTSDLCLRANHTTNIYCGSVDERVPASAFRFFFYELWASQYQASSIIMLSDFRDVLFQNNPFSYHLNDWYPDYQLAVFQEFYPNMVISRCWFNRRLVLECFGEEVLRGLGRRVVISSGGMMGSRDAVLSFSHLMTMLLQEAPGRQVGETRCSSGGIEHSFINYLIYHSPKLRQLVRVKVFAQGEGAVNSLGGLRPDTVSANLTGNLRTFWKILDDDGFILNWSGEVSPMVHQLDHYKDELYDLAQELLTFPRNSSGGGGSGGYRYSLQSLLLPGAEGQQDIAWQALAAARCLWGCKEL